MREEERGGDQDKLPSSFSFVRIVTFFFFFWKTPFRITSNPNLPNRQIILTANRFNLDLTVRSTSL